MNEDLRTLIEEWRGLEGEIGQLMALSNRFHDKLEAVRGCLLLWKMDCDGAFGIDCLFDDVTECVDDLLAILDRGTNDE